MDFTPDRSRANTARLHNSNPEPWHLDKKIPVGIILVVTIQLVGFAYMYGKLEERVSTLEDNQKTLMAVFREVPERLAKLETILENIDNRLVDTSKDLKDFKKNTRENRN